MNADTARHGTRTAYKWHTATGTPTCVQCRTWRAAAAADYKRRRYLAHSPLMVDSTGTRRRLQALAALGWSSTDLARLLGVVQSTVNHWSRRPHVHLRTARRVADLYEQLSMQVGPTPKARAYALRCGWPPPLAWGDDIDSLDAQPEGVAA